MRFWFKPRQKIILKARVWGYSVCRMLACHARDHRSNPQYPPLKRDEGRGVNKMSGCKYIKAYKLIKTASIVKCLKYGILI